MARFTIHVNGTKYYSAKRLTKINKQLSLLSSVLDKKILFWPWWVHRRMHKLVVGRQPIKVEATSALKWRFTNASSRCSDYCAIHALMLHCFNLLLKCRDFLLLVSHIDADFAFFVAGEWLAVDDETTDERLLVLSNAKVSRCLFWFCVASVFETNASIMKVVIVLCY